MSSSIAFLRGINVGGNKKVEMSRLKDVFEKMGFSQVSTYINSGNVIFSSSNTNFSSIEKTLSETFGFEIPVIIRDLNQITELVERIPETWNNDTEQKTDILFLTNEYRDEASLKLIKTNPEVDRLIYFDGVIVWNIDRNQYSKSGIQRFIGSVLYKNMTARNINTIRKLAQLGQ